MLKSWSIVISIVFVCAAQHAPSPDPGPACDSDLENSGCSEYQKPDNSKRFFLINGTKLSIDWNIHTVTLECLINMGPMDIEALPYFRERQDFDNVWIQGCTLGNASVSDLLRALNASVAGKLALERVCEPLRAAHLAALRLRAFMLSAGACNTTVLEPDFFPALEGTGLSELWTSGVRYSQPPRGLSKWTATNAMLRRLPANALLNLTALYLTEPLLSDVSALAAASGLRTLSVTAPLAELPPLPALLRLWLYGWTATNPVPLASCEGLESVSVLNAAPRLPAGWLAGCARLRELELRFVRLAVLPADLVRHNLALEQLSIRNAGLTSQRLPVDLLATNTNLTTLNLSHNKLTTIPSALFFKHLEKLEVLDLSYNSLTTPTWRFPAAPALLQLRLSHNPLGDACPDHHSGLVRTPQNSWLQELTSLRVLYLQSTGTSRLCRDWLMLMPYLADLQLADNFISELTYEDMHPVRNQSSIINLLGNNITTISYSSEDYVSAGAVSEDRTRTTIKLDSPLRCDCGVYWFAAALARFPAHAHAAPRCSDGGALRARDLARLACGAACGPRCACQFVPARAQHEARCDALPPADGAPPDFLLVANLSLANTNLTALPRVDMLPPPLTELDLRNNSIGRATEEELALLRRAGLRLWMSGNPLDCRCGYRALVDALITNQGQVLDFNDLLCSDSTPVERMPCGVGVGTIAPLVVVAVAALAAAVLLACLWRPRTRARLKMALRALGVRLPEPAAKDDQQYKYDVFVSFAEAEGAWVARQLVPALERAGRRACVHYRDWAAGELIPRQIAESVRVSRRTLLVVSEAFARSAWARAELQAALAASAAAARPAPLVVLRAAPSPAALAAAPQLAEYLRAATYVRADDPRLLPKLLAALPAAAAA